MRLLKIMLGLALAAFAFLPSELSAQEAEHLQIGLFGDSFRVSQTDSNLLGVGARVAFPIFHRVKLEGEMAYDFNQAFTEGFNFGGTIAIQRTDMRLLHGEFGPKIDLGHRRLHPFVFLKGGFTDFQLSGAPATLGTFVSSVENLRLANINGVFYPGGGLEGRLGPVGLRLDVGDEMYFNHGTHNNLRVSFGPFIRF
jgi:hypothetical protein